MTPTLATAALTYAAKGWPVLPLEPGGKRPAGRLVPHGLRQATTDPVTIRRWWTTEPAANIGLRTGVAFDVLDIDSPAALQALDALMPLADHPDDDPMVIGPTVKTPRGWHAYVSPLGRGNTVRVAGITGIDWRGAGGYVVAPGSAKTDGAGWSWLSGPTDPLYGVDAPIRPAPAWIVALLERPTPPPTAGDRTGRHAEGYARTALDAEAGRVALAPEGARNDQLNKSAHALGQLVAGGLLDVATAGDTLLAAALRAGLSDEEAVATIRSGLAAGMRQPRRPKATS